MWSTRAEQIVMMKRPSLILAAAVMAFAILIIAFCAGLIRPPRPMFHESYAAGGFGLVPIWQPNPVLADCHGHWLWTDNTDNLLVIQATGTAEHGRSHAMTGGTQAARFRLGSAWDDQRDDQYVRIPRMRDALVAILPDGRSKGFPLQPGQASRFFLQERDDPSDDLLQAAESLLDGTVKEHLRGFLEGYSRPEDARPRLTARQRTRPPQTASGHSIVTLGGPVYGAWVLGGGGHTS